MLQNKGQSHDDMDFALYFLIILICFFDGNICLAAFFR